MLHAGKNPKSMYAPGRKAFSPPEDFQVTMPWAKVGAWYVGPKAENEEIYKEMVIKAMDAHLDFRKNYFPSDPPYITPEIKDSLAYKTEIENMRRELATMREEMKKSVPYFTPRYKVNITNIAKHIKNILWHGNMSFLGQTNNPVRPLFEKQLPNLP